MNTKLSAKMLGKLSNLAILNDPIDPSLYEKYDVKRGLRNSNGTGVLVGLTRIGDVVGYEMLKKTTSSVLSSAHIFF